MSWHFERRRTASRPVPNPWRFCGNDFFDYVFWPYAYDDFWPYAYDDVYYGIYGPYAYGGVGVGSAAGQGVSVPSRSTSTAVRRVAGTSGSEQRTAEVCSSNAADLTNWPIDRISEIVQPTDAQRPELEELRAASSKAIDILRAGCPTDLPSTPTGRLGAMESRLQVMLQAVQTVRPPLDRFYQSLTDEQKARFNALSPGNESTTGEDQHGLTSSAMSGRRASPTCRSIASSERSNPHPRSRARSTN
jgi:hypothetical protein